MLVKNLALKNIRSYNDGEEVRLDLPAGVVLFEGDIGSGKSTLLYALEFGLFGFSDMKGAHLLSEGKDHGRVSITFESDGKEYTVERQLRARGRDVIQDDCYISSDGERTRLSPSDLKERVVSLLGFNEPTHPKAESLVYRYAVFTPQEQMKEILVQNPEQRLQVIRRVLGAQSYQVAAENSDLVEKRIRMIAYGLKKAGEDLEETKEELRAKSATVERLTSEIPKLQENESLSSRAVEALTARLKEFHDVREALKKSEGKLPLLRQEVGEIQSEMGEHEQELRDGETALAQEIAPVVARFESRAKPRAPVRELEESLDRAKDELSRLRELKGSMEADLERDRDLLSKGVCPLCGQPVSRDLPARTEHSERELAGLEGKIGECTASAKRLSDDLDDARAFEGDAREYEHAVREKGRLEREVKALRKKLQQSNARLSQRLTELAEATARTKEMQGVTAQIGALDRELGEARRKERRAVVELGEARTKLEDAARELAKLEDDVRKKRRSLEDARRLSSYQGWLSTFFRPTVELIEKQTLAQAAARFNEHFQRFFASLVDDPDMVVRVKEDFSPLFERQGFEQDFEALSGGERTSMALAYRFALNSVVKETVSSRPELMILDEPTDGFSKEQVFKMRGLLEELGSRQVILVSHEKELESMADHIFRVRKQNGTSTVADAAQT